MQFLAALEAAWRVLVAALILGAGLPALYGFGVRQLAIAGRVEAQAKSRAVLHRGVAWASFGLAVLAVLLGLTYIVAHGFGVKVTFNGLMPVISR